MPRGVVTGVDKKRKIVSGDLSNGLHVLEATYVDFPPHVGEHGTFQQVSNSQWIYLGALGERASTSGNHLDSDVSTFEGLTAGPNLITNGAFETDTTGWTGTNCTLAAVATFPHSGLNSMRVRSSSTATMSAKTATGTSGMRVQPLRGYTVRVWVRTAVTVQPFLVRIYWYKQDGSASAAVSNDGASTNDSLTYTERIQSFVAPSDAYFAAIELEWNTPAAANEDHHVDDITMSQAVPGWVGDREAGIALSSVQAHSGTQSLVMVPDTALFSAPNASSDPFNVPVTPGSAWEASFWVRSVTGTPPVGAALVFADAFGNPILPANRGPLFATSSTVWDQRMVTGVAPTVATHGIDAAYVTIKTINATPQGQFYIDDVEIKEVTNTQSGYAGGNFRVKGDLVVDGIVKANQGIVGPFAAFDSVLTDQSTTSTTFTNLTTVGPSVTVQAGDSLVVAVGCQMYGNTVGNGPKMGYEATGPTFVAADNSRSAYMDVTVAGFALQMSFVSAVSGLTPGTYTVTAKYKAGGAGGTVNFANRWLIVFNVGSIGS